MLGWLVRRAHAETVRADAAPELAQERVLRALAKAIKGTEIAQDPAIFADLATFKRSVRLTRAVDHAPLVQQAMAAPRPNAFEPGVTRAFAFSSSGLKYTPYTRAHVRMFRRYQLAVVGQAVCDRGIDELLSGRLMMFQLPLGIGRCASGAKAGYSTALMVDVTPWLLKQRLTPSIAALKGPLEPRLDAIARAFVEKKPLVITSIPENLQGYIGLLKQRPDFDRVREALYDLRAYAWGGSTLQPYEGLLREFMRPDIKLYDAVSATEGPLGFGCERGVYRLALNHALHLFHKDGALFWPWEVERDEIYDVVTSSFCGLLGYLGGDRVRIVATKPLRFALVPRVQPPSGAWDYSYCKDDNTLYAEGDVKAEGKVVRLERFTLATGFVKAQDTSMPKLPRHATRAQLDRILRR